MKIFTEKQLQAYTQEVIDSVTSYPAVGADSEWAAFLSGKGVAASPKEALQIAAVFRCVDLGSKTMAAMPLHMLKKTKDGKVKAEEHNVYPLVYIQPNKFTTAYDFWQMYVVNLMLTRGAFAKIKRNAAGKITELWNIPTSCVTGPTLTDDGRQYIKVIDSKTGQSEVLMDGEFMYTPNFRLNDVNDSENPLSMASRVLGLSSSMNSFADKGFSGVSPGGYIEYPGTLSDKSYERFKNDFLTNYAGVENAGKWLFLEQGAKANRWTQDMEKTQLLDSRKFSISEVCRVFGIPPHLCFDLEHATFSNIEQQSLEYVRDFVNPLSVHLEQTMYKDLLADNEKKKYCFKFNTAGLLRGDTAARTAYYNSARQNGWLNTNEIRELEDFNGIGELGETYYINGAMLPLDTARYNAPKNSKQKGETE